MCIACVCVRGSTISSALAEDEEAIENQNIAIIAIN